MNIFKSGTFTWWQAAILKVSLLSIGLAIGSTWAEVFAPYAVVLAIIGIALGLYLIPAWFKK
jgi:hypothetical protein